MSITLRDYQVKLINDAREALKKNRGVLLCSPTGSGKTATNSFMTKSAAEKGMITWFVVHRQELLEQSSRAFASVGIPHSFVASGLPLNPKAVVQICSVMTLARRMDKLPPPKFIVWDECQYMGAATWDKICMANLQAYHIGLTATPWRMDGKPFSKYFQEIVYGPSVKELIDKKYLSDYKLYAPTSFDTSSINIKAGEYDMKQVELLITSNQIVGDYFSVWNKHAKGKKTIVFAPTIEASKIIVSRFMENGVRAAHVDGETSNEERRSILRRFAAGEITVISNIKLFTEGLDIPAIECVMLCRPTRSLSLYLQMLGRGLRPSPDKAYTIILDQVNACREHGLPDDEREWSLDGRKKKKKSDSENASPVKICQTCFAANESFNHFCTNCGAPFEIKMRQGPEQVDGELEEIKKEQFRKEQKRIQAQAKTLDDLIKIGIERKYKNPRFWAMKVLESRKRK
jgi:superfamily II DNA or RNA helicase